MSEMENTEKRTEELSEIYKDKADEIKKQQYLEQVQDIEMPSTWSISDKGKEAIKISMGMNKTKHGLYSAIPMVCKEVECPFAAVCPLLQMDLAPKGERCPLEIGMIMNKYDEYKEEFQVDESDIVDMGLIKDLIDYDIQIFRADNKIAIEGDFVEDVVVSVTDRGEAITNPQLSKAVEYKDKIQAKKYKALQLMHSTRSDKAGDKSVNILDPSSYAAQLMNQMNKRTIVVESEDE